jgi:hypothetical protein
MKKNVLHLGVFVVVLAVLLLEVMPVIAAHKTTYTCQELPGEVLDEGVWTFLPNGNIHLRGFVMKLPEVVSDPRLSGDGIVVMNANWDANFTGPIWGTDRLVNDGGGWEGTWEGKMTEQGSVYHSADKGFGGYEGMMSWRHMDRGVCTGELLEH